MLVQDPLSGYLHEVPDVQPNYGDYRGGYYGDYNEYFDPRMAEYPGGLGHLGIFLLPKLINAITGGGKPPPQQQPLMAQTTGAGFMPSPELRAYIASVVREVLAQTGPGAGPMAPGAVPMVGQGGVRRRRRRR